MLEVIAKNIKDIKKINKTNADRIEFCDNVEAGGTTPRIKAIQKAVKISDKPIMVIVRNHIEDFQTNNKLLRADLNYIEAIRIVNPQGIVWGAITKDNKIDEEALSKVIAAKGEMELTFHKAFDYVTNKIAAAKILKKAGVTRILTSGGIGSPLQNLDELKALKKVGIEILVGGGVTKENFEDIIAAGFNNIHIGRAARKNNSWVKGIDIHAINNIFAK